ncbi:hypothetical protein GCM10022631_10460 [Deinococcus rubellus]|uniref:replication initiator protein A n=1 Tax=Deinococcus rubellus TaxID=1889240 RepID=UPI0031EC155D
MPDLSRADTELIRVNELDLTRAGIISVQKVMPSESASWQTEYVIGDVQHQVQGHAVYGRPYGSDADVLLAIQTLFFMAGCPEDNSISFTPSAVLKLMINAPSGREYTRIREALLRLSGVKWKLTRTRWDAKKNKLVGKTNVSGLLSRLELVDDVSGNDKAFGERTLNEQAVIQLTFTPDFAATIRDGLFQILDGELLSRLGQPSARSLYRVLQAHRIQTDETLSHELSVSANDWLRACGMESDRFDNAKRTLDAAQIRLLDEGYLKDAGFTGRGKAGMFQYTFASAPEPKLVDLLLARGVTRPVAESLAADHPDRVRPAIQSVDERLGSGWKPRSLPASLVDAVRNPTKWGYTPAPEKVKKGPTKVRPTSDPPPEPLDPRAALLSSLKLKLRRALSPMAQEALAELSPAGLDLLRSALMKPTPEYLALAEQLLGSPL